MMEQFEYDVTNYPHDVLIRRNYFCFPTGECVAEEAEDTGKQCLKDIMNQKGVDGWELVQFEFGRQGVTAFWKRRIIR